MTLRNKHLKAFLATAGFLREEQAGLVRPQSPANFLRVLCGLSLLSQRSFLFAATIGGYSGRAAILSRERPGAFLVPSRPPLLLSWTYRLALPSHAGCRESDEVGLSPVNVVSHFVQVAPPVTLTVRGS